MESTISTTTLGLRSPRCRFACANTRRGDHAGRPHRRSFTNAVVKLLPLNPDESQEHGPSASSLLLTDQAVPRTRAGLEAVRGRDPLATLLSSPAAPPAFPDRANGTERPPSWASFRRHRTRPLEECTGRQGSRQRCRSVGGAALPAASKARARAGVRRHIDRITGAARSHARQTLRLRARDRGFRPAVSGGLADVVTDPDLRASCPRGSSRFGSRSG